MTAEHAQKALLTLAADLLRSPEGQDRALVAIGALRAEVDRVTAAAEGAAGGEAAVLPPLREALRAAHPGLAAALLPEGAGLAALRAGLARLHAHMAALSAASHARQMPGA